MARMIELTTPLGKDVLLFYAMQGHEDIARLSEFDLSALSSRADISPGDLLGKNITVKLELRGGGHRYFNGYVTRFSPGGMVGRYFQYRMIVRPWLWFLTRTADCRIFQDKTVPEIIKDVFADHSMATFEDGLTGAYVKREYCVQYRETDFDFVSRLMEEEGIYYYFDHHDGRHVLKLVDSYSGHKALEHKATIAYYPPGRPTRADEEYIHAWTFSQGIQPGVTVLDDYDFTKPKADLTVKSKLVQRHERSDYEVFDWPGEYHETGDGEHLVRARIDELHSEFERAEAECNVREIAVGRLFNLTNAPRRDQESEFLIVRAGYELRDNAYETSPTEPSTYRCWFTALQSRQQFRSARVTPRPIVRGPQTAVVVGPKGEEIYCDKYGRVKVQFHWDRYGKADENSSCWIRVAQNIAGKRWGMIFIPRIGQEVIVDFEEGNPDCPLITGAVYNAQEMPPYELAEHKTKTVLFKSNTTLGGNGFNEIRIEDKKGEEQIFIHAERNKDIRIKKDLYETVEESSHHTVGKDQLVEIRGDRHDRVKGDENRKVDGTASLEAGMDLQEKVSMKYALAAGTEIHLKSGVNLVVESGTTLTLKVGGNFININPGGVFISGSMVMINSGGSSGSGAGSSPEPPKAPTEADKAKPGEVSQPLAAKPIAATPMKPTSYSPAAMVLKQAAQNGTPFCEAG